MPLGPRPSDVPRIRKTLTVYKVSSYITGFFLIALVVMMVTRYGLGGDIELGGQDGFLALTPQADISGVNVSTIILIMHGWFYVLYLACDFVLWRLLRFSFGRFLLIALGGVIPFLSFYFERTVPSFVEARLAQIEPKEVPA